MVVNKKFSKILIILSLLFVFSIPVFVLAEGYQPLAPLPGISDGKIGGIGEYLNIIFQWMIAIAVVTAVLMIIFGGVQYMTTDAVFAKAEGLKKIQSAVGGLLLALVSWLILNTINPKLLDINIELKNKGVEEGGLSVNTQNNGPGGVTSTVSGGASGAGGVTSGATNQEINPQEYPIYGSHDDVLAAIRDYGVTINDGSRTSLDGMRSSTVSGIGTIATDCCGGNGFVITGGTESGHAGGTYSHGNGFKFDVGQNSNTGTWGQFNSYIEGVIGNNNPSQNTTYSGTLSNGQKIEARLEPDSALHWDIKVLP